MLLAIFHLQLIIGVVHVNIRFLGNLVLRMFEI
jgi:hypothetical protein